MTTDEQSAKGDNSYANFLKLLMGVDTAALANYVMKFIDLAGGPSAKHEISPHVLRSNHLMHTLVDTSRGR